MNRKTAKTKVLDSFSQSVSIRLVTSLPLNLVLFLIYSLVVNETSPAGFLKGYIFLLVLVETFFLRRTLRSIHRQTGYWEVLRGDSKGGEPPLCRRGGGVHRGGTPSKALWGMPLRGRVCEHAFGYREIKAILKAAGKITETLKTARCATVHPEGERG